MSHLYRQILAHRVRHAQDRDQRHPCCITVTKPARARASSLARYKTSQFRMRALQRRFQQFGQQTPASF